MSGSDNEEKPVTPLESEVRHLKIETESPSEVPSSTTRAAPLNVHSQPATPNGTAAPVKAKPESLSPIKMESRSQSPVKGEREEVVGGDITVKLEPGRAPKLSRTTSQKVIARPPPLFLDWEDKTEQATSTFQVLPDCIYAAKYLGSTEHALECDCAEEWDSVSKTNHACGEDSDCINRATKMECVGDCGCGSGCQNQRFQQKQYADVTVIKTEKKGYGLRANTDLRAHDFIFEYIGEVINEAAFRRRMHQYDEEGIKHFYFMSLSKGEFVDATKKGNLGRFCNHSCNPNCYVDKWVVGDKLRMGIFAERNVKAGEELVFNYNVDRYGADPQPCYCGEPNCTGFIGGKTQTERATKLSNTTIEALGIDDGDGWDLAVAKKPRKKKQGEDDEEYVNNIEPKALDEGGIPKVMATLMQCKEKWITVKLLGRIQRCDNEKALNRVIRMHGYEILRTQLLMWIDDFNVALQILDVLYRFPRITRNKIQDSKIEEAVQKLTACGDERVETKANEMLQIWSQLEVGYRIPRVKRDPNAVVAAPRDDRRRDPRDRSKSKSPSRSPDAPRGPSAPSGPRNNMPQRGGFFGPRPPYRPRFPPNALPAGWFSAIAAAGQTYYYSASGQTTWQRPTAPAAQAPPPPPPKVITHEQRLQEIINSITKSTTPKEKSSASATPQPAQEEPQKEKTERKEKWRSYPEEKQKKLYENTLAPSIQYVMNKYKKQLPRDDLKRLAKEISKTLANSDFKHKRVKDPTKISPEWEKKVKKHVTEFFAKAVAKKKEYDKKKAERKAKEVAANGSSATTVDVKFDGEHGKAKVEEDDKADVSDIELEEEKVEPDSPSEPSPNTPDLKRKRGASSSGVSPQDDDAAQLKKFKTETPPPPPPPPPPPAEDMPDSVDDSGFTNEADVSGSFTDEALEAVNGASAYKLEAGGTPARDWVPTAGYVKQEHLDSPALNGHPSPMQLATPPTNGSDEQERNVRAKSHGFEGMNPERLRQLGITSD